MKKWLLILFLTANAVVLLGQLWPGGAPEMASKATLVFLLSTATYFTVSLTKIRWRRKHKVG
jgi:hypothetical protein